MSVLKCKMCGGDLEVQEGMSVCECEYCGSKQTVPSADNEKKITMFTRANRLRSACEFDKASGVYESIAAEFPEEAEAYWGMLLCKYGIEYVDDPVSGKKVPTCHRSSFDSIMEDADFEMVMENADTVSRSVYREEAKAIEALRTGIIEVSSKEDPYDIFICYKETDLNGERTIDSVLAQDIYDELTEKGYRVFFSRITLEDKLGQEYEPYIFAALHSAKVMLAIGTDYEYYNAVWVKNEWSRFLSLMEKGEKKTLIPCFKNLDAYDIPKEFARLQAQDLGKVGAVQDLLRGIGKILGEKNPEYAGQEIAAQQTILVNAAEASRNVELENLLKAGNMDLEEGKYKDAQEKYKKALEIDCESAEGYLGLILAGIQEKDQEVFAEQYVRAGLTLVNSAKTWKDNLERAKKVAKGELKEWLDSVEKRRAEYVAFTEEEENRLKPVRERNHKVRALVETGNFIWAAIRTDRTVVADGGYMENVADWEDIVAFGKGSGNTYKELIGIKADGTLVGGDDSIANWNHIKEICTCSHTVGLKEDGTVLAVGNNEVGQCKTKDWKDIVAIDVSYDYTVGLKKDGTVVVTGGKEYRRRTEAWTNVIAVSLGDNDTAALRSDGTVWATAGNSKVTSWTDVVELYTKSADIIGLRKDGTLLYSGIREDVAEELEKWRNIIQVKVARAGCLFLGLKADGSVVAWDRIGKYGRQCEIIRGWKDIVALAGDMRDIMGIQADGRVVQACAEPEKQHDISSWRLFQSIDTLEEEREEALCRRAEYLEGKRRQNEEKRRQLEAEKKQLIEEAGKLGLFAGKRRKEIEKRVEEIVEELKCLK